MVVLRLLLLALFLLGLTASTPPDGESLVSETFDRQFDDVRVRTTLEVSAANDAEITSRRLLTVRLGSSLAGSDNEEQAAVLNGLILVALPEGATMVGGPRLYYTDPDGSAHFMYSRPLPRLERLGNTATEQRTATSGSPQERLEALAELSLALDSDLSVAGPVDPRLSGADGYTVQAYSWLMPGTMSAEEVVNPFDLSRSLMPTANIELRVPLAVSGADPVLLYVGGLSTAAREVELSTDELPPTALPLVPLPESAPIVPETEAAAEEGDVEAEESSDDAPEPEPDPELVPETSDEPETGADQEPVRAIVYSYDWVTWEGELDASAFVPASPDSRPRPSADRPAVRRQSVTAAPEPPEPESEPEIEPEAEPEPEPARISRGSRATAGTPRSRDSASPPDERVNAVEASADATDESQSEPPEHQGVAREVAPGTLPDEANVYRVALKPITNRAPLTAAPGVTPPPGLQQSGPAPADLGEMVLIPAGPFEMGTSVGPLDNDADEAPQHSVELPAYLIDKYPVTNRQFYEFVINAGYKPQGNWERFYEPATADLPVRSVSWNDAAAYAKWAGKRLPSEAEWEKAARSDDARMYPWGNDWSSAILPREDAFYSLVNSPKIASPYGVMAMCGVLWQWTASSYAAYPFNPKAAGEKKVLRGGCFSNGRNVVRAANRYAEPPAVALNTFAFRCAKDV